MSAPLIDMKIHIISPAAVLLLLILVCCDNGIFHSEYVLDLPKPPESWVSLLGEPHWRIEWQNPEGKKQVKDIKPAKNIGVSLPQTWPNAVSAWPFWPEKGVAPGAFKPAGALFPYDVSDNRLKLSWKAGPDAVYYWELARADRQDAKPSSVPRFPHYFNWPRFRELFETGIINEKVIQDPWLADWQSIAKKTVLSGFDRRRIVPVAAGEMNIPVPAGPWYGSSPFTTPLIFEDGNDPVFPVWAWTDIWVSAEGILRCNQNAWVFYHWNSF